MGSTLKKTIIGISIGTMLSAIIGSFEVLVPESIVFTCLWGLGSAFAFNHHISTLLKMLNPGLKLSVISFLTFRNGFMGSVPILVYVTYCILFGWVHGLVLFCIEISRIHV